MEPRNLLIARLSEILRVYGRHVNTAVFLLGFLLDIFTLPRIDHPLVPYIVGGHMTIIGGSILVNRILYEKRGDRFERLQTMFPLLTAFSFGALLSFLFIYYARSGAPGASWPFLILLGVMMFGSEFFRKKLEGLRFYVILYVFLWVLLSVLFVPILLGQITVATFFLSIVAGLLFACAYIALLFTVTSRETRLILPRTLQSVSVGVVLLIASYFSGVMPAIPLVLKEGDVYSNVVRTASGEYLREGSPRQWYTGLLTPRTHEWTKGSPVYFYSAVFAPTDLSGTIVHDWQYKNGGGDWTSVTRVSFPIRGGRAEGYRGYSFKESVTIGEWRVVVSLSDGRVVGRVPFRIHAR